MSFMICTPCYASCVNMYFMQSNMALLVELMQKGIPHEWNFIGNESLITRGRDTLAADFLRSDFERLLFIDSDISYRVADIIRLWNLDADIAVGAYRVKKPDSFLTVWKDGKLTDINTFTEPFEVDFAGTGFMMIKREVFEKLKNEEIRYENGDPPKDVWGFFQDPILTNWKASEDYYFCEKAREAGFKIICDPAIRVSHWGLYAF